jgi:hypothetical protein
VLLLSNWGPPRAVGVAVAGVDCPKWRGPDLPVMSRFLKLSTSSDALLAPRAGLCEAPRSSTTAASCGSSEASVLANGFAGMLPVDKDDCGAWYPILEPDHASVEAMSLPCPALCAYNCPAGKSALGMLTGGRVDRESISYPSSFSRWGRGEDGKSYAWSVSGCGMKVVFDSMRTCFFVLGGGAARPSGPVTRLLPVHSRSAQSQGMIYRSGHPPSPQARCLQ